MGRKSLGRRQRRTEVRAKLGLRASEDRLPARVSVKDVNRDKKRESDRQEAEKKRQQDKDAKVETLQK